MHMYRAISKLCSSISKLSPQTAQIDNNSVNHNNMDALIQALQPFYSNQWSIFSMLMMSQYYYTACYLSAAMWLMCAQLRELSPDELDSFMDKLSICKLNNCFVISLSNCVPLNIQQSK